MASYGRAECGDECESVILVSIIAKLPLFQLPYFQGFDNRDLELNVIRLAFWFSMDSYDMFKQTLISTGHFQDDIRTHVLSSALGGTVAVTLVAPIDVIKSRVQSSVGNVVSRPVKRTAIT